MQISREGLEHIKKWEGCKLTAYQPVKGDRWTIGYGSTGDHVFEGKKISQKEAEKLLLKDLERFEHGVNGLVNVKLTQCQYDALVSFSFNLGMQSLRESTLLRRLNACNYQEAADQILRWDKFQGKPLKGLTNRRISERDLFLGNGSKKEKAKSKATNGNKPKKETKKA